MICCNLYSLYIFGDYASAFQIAEAAETEIFDIFLGQLPVVDCCFFYALTAAALYPSASFAEKIRYYFITRRNRRRMKKWAENCPENFLHKYLLIEAEACRIWGKGDKAMALYERAIKSAHENEYIQIEAIGNELAGKFQLERGFDRMAKIYLTEARNCFEKWGASGKVKYIEEKYPMFFPRHEIKPSKVAVSNKDSQVTDIDMISVVKASEAISSSFELDKLMKNLMRIVIQNAGAQKGVLIMEKTGSFQVVAENIKNSTDIIIKECSPGESSSKFPAAVVNYAVRTGKAVLIDDAARDKDFSGDPYVVKNRSRSIMCLPLTHHGKKISILYFENNLIPNAFTSERTAVLNLLSSQIAISLENALLYKEKEDILRSVHDSLSADIYNIILMSEPPYNSDPSKQEMQKRQEIIHTLSHGCLDNIKDFLFSADSENATLTALMDRISNYAQNVFDPLKIDFTFENKGCDGEMVFSQIAIFNIYMIFKEAVNNITKHSRSSSVVMSAVCEEGSLYLKLQDNGIGCKIDEISKGGRGLGNMHKRAEIAGATFTIESSPEKGTRITLRKLI